MFILRAPAKINWFLKIIGRRKDGYHEIQSLIQKITLYDQLSFSLSDELKLETSAPIPMEQNLVYKAATLLKERYAVKRGARISLDKHIPTGAGLGGGSSDAAVALEGLNELWSLALSREDLYVLAEQLGSDVPLFLYGPLSLVSGRGEKIVPRRAGKTLDILLVKPSFDVSTERVYKNFSLLTKKVEKVNNIEPLVRNIESAEISGLTDVASNDLESVTIKSFPVIAEIKERMFEQGALFSLMSGSGSTVFGVFESRKKATEAARSFNEFWTAVVQTIAD